MWLDRVRLFELMLLMRFRLSVIRKLNLLLITDDGHESVVVPLTVQQALVH